MSKECRICRRNHHSTRLHEPDARRNQMPSSMGFQGRRRYDGQDHAYTSNVQVNTQQPVVSKCTQICRGRASKKYCAEIVQIKVHPNEISEKAV